jgi:hypothetical protein
MLLDQYRRRRQVVVIGDRWPDKLATHAARRAPRGEAGNATFRALLDTVSRRKQRNGTSRRGKPWRLLRLSGTELSLRPCQRWA